MPCVGVGCEIGSVPRLESIVVRNWQGKGIMTAERLIDVLSANLEPLAGDGLRKGVRRALTSGGASALGLMFITVGPRPELGWPKAPFCLEPGRYCHPCVDQIAASRRG